MIFNAGQGERRLNAVPALYCGRSRLPSPMARVTFPFTPVGFPLNKTTLYW